MAFTKGKSGNPGGRGTEKPFRDALRIEIAEAGSDPKRLREIARAMIDKAISGDVPAANFIADRLDGKPAQAIVGGDDGDNPVNVLHRIENVIVDPKRSGS